jgi:alpha-L-fucosidase 2
MHSHFTAATRRPWHFVFIIAFALHSSGDQALAGRREHPTKRVLWTNEPLVFSETVAKSPRYSSRNWERSVYPLGNGRLGCTAFGEPRRERIQFNEDSLWVGNEDCTGGYQPFGDVYVEMPHAEYSDYRRELDISRAVQTITYTSGGVRYTREYFASHPAQVMVFRFSADKAGALAGKVSMGNLHEISITAKDGTLTMTGDTSKFWWWQVHLAQPKRLLGSREYASDKNIDLDLEAQVRILHDGGTVKTADNTVVFANCDTMTLLLAADTNYLNRRDKGWLGSHPHERVSAQIAAAAKRPYAELLAEHVADCQSLYGRLSIDLGDTPAAATALPTAERVKAYSEQVRKKAGPAVDRDLEALLYQYARYLMISCSRPGEGALPANLQGLWLLSKRPAWRCDYHTDINLQMNYWFTSASNLPECFIPAAEWIDSIREVRKDETRKVLKVKRGWLMRSENGVFGGSTWHFQKGDSAWLCQNLWDHYAFTQDREYLKRYAYPIMKEISEFWVDHLKELPDGTLVAPDGRSPEHGPEKADGVSYDQQLCWDLFTNVIEASEVLGVDGEYRRELIAKRKKLLGPRIGRWGQLQEWMEDIDDPKDKHRHINHMIAVYPGRQIHPTTTPKLAEAAKVGLVARGDGGPGWSQAWKACVYARLLDGERAYTLLSGLIASRIHGNLWAIHPPFQIDCNFGYPAGVNEMLVQSHMGYIHLLPALPKAWLAGSVRGFRVRGGYELDLEWKDGQLTEAVLRGISNKPGKVQVRSGEHTCTFALTKGESRVLRASDFSSGE